MYTLYFLLIGSTVSAMDLALTAGTVSFFPVSSERTVDEGLYAQLGLRAPLNERLELEASLVGCLTPDPADPFGFSLCAGIPVLGASDVLYFNMIADAGLLYFFSAGDTGDQPLLFLRISPVTLGSDQNIHRGSLFTTGLLYDVRRRSFSVSFSMILEHIFFTRM